jgi:hypothetical protein
VSTFSIEPFKNLTPDELRQKCRALVRENIHKDQLVCMLAKSGLDGMPNVFADEVRQIVSEYCEDDCLQK